ncbi:hypothetical protein D3C79_460410 [compost metagenome]
MAQLGRVQAIRHGLTDRDQQTTPQPLQQPPAKQAVDRASAARQRRAEAEQGQRQQQRLALAQTCCQSCTQRNCPGQTQHVQVGDPTQLRHGSVQCLAERRICRVECEHVEQVEGESQQVDNSDFVAVGHDALKLIGKAQSRHVERLE